MKMDFAGVGAALGLLAGALVVGPAVRAEDAPIALVPHRAVYELGLGETRGSSPVAGVRGRIVYDFSGSDCEGYSLDFRQVSEVDSGEGKVSTSDLHSTTWEDRKKFTFSSENSVNQNVVDTVEGSAEHGDNVTTINLTKPATAKLDLDPNVVFPTQHMARAIAAARAGTTILNFPVYDGSETGDKVFDTLTVIGRKLGASEHRHADTPDAADAEPKLADVPRWPVTISYFEKDRNGQSSSEQSPVYAIGFELYDNGISRALTLDYNDFVITGKLTTLELKQPKACQ